MNVKQTLIRHRDIQDWVIARHGMPAIERIPSSTGAIKARLTLSFAKRRSRPEGMPTIDDDGMSPCSWNAWLAELDRQQLALKVSAEPTDFELVERKESAERDFNAELH